ncbi:hypothetical protein [Pseudoxanthomonas wuyuanensis]|uniref:Uncharacterized protein n=1 Tax=Pseudoxanthomonas wuyuanensis TaxID=1073196 RepID=A0A286D4P8_9GAMM|nr:hypothetical protein [Pseudoxanthomonas wuyuanensis]SOD53640.1 hypothetical protein SAMN06296416_102514 [Pseudoxanthomonas wuyuanensis]
MDALLSTATQTNHRRSGLLESALMVIEELRTQIDPGDPKWADHLDKIVYVSQTLRAAVEIDRLYR